jgi:uncharacterized membrane protein YphA (DoxX/SURF4 family)
MFPAGLPGIALLLLRLSVAAMLFIDQAGRLLSPTPPWLLIVSAIAALAVILGFLTPLFALICGLLKVSALAGATQILAPLVILTLLLAAAVAMLGPGAYSLDAKMFGRRIVLLPPQR